MKVAVWAVAALALAAFLRFAHLGQIPACLEYDEAANVILAGEIAQGKAFPLFIRPYTGKESLYFYLAAGMMRLAGVTPFVLRLTSAYLGMLGVALSYWFARELLAACGLGEGVRRWLAAFSAALVAVSYWQVNLSRFGYRAIVLPPLLALTFGCLLRGLRAVPKHLPESSSTQRPDSPSLKLSGRWGQWAWIALAGAWAGLSAYTYSSVRILPILLLLVWIWILASDRRRWRLRLGQLAIFGGVALLVFAPLGVFFLRNPQAFSVRLEQVSVLSPSVHKGDPWGALWRTMRLAFGMYTFAGDMNPLYNFPGKPVFDRLLGPFFYLGLLLCAWGLVARKPGFSVSERQPQASRGSARRVALKPGFFPRLPYFLLPAWLLVMMVPNVLSASGVPHNLRAMALVPAAFVVAALGIVTAVRWMTICVEKLARFLPQRHEGHGEEAEKSSARSASPWFSSRSPLSLSLSLVLVLLLGYEGVRTYHHYVHLWARSAAPYYKGNQALIRAAELIDAYPEADPYVATYFQQHATLAVAARRYGEVRWMSGRTLVLPPPGAPPALLVYDHTNPVDPLLRDRLLPPDALLHRELGPDGGIGFEAYWVSTKKPGFSPNVPMHANLGHTLVFLGYDLNAPAVSGGALDVTLYFEVLRAVEQDDYTFFAHLSDELGFHWGGETFFHYPSAGWRPGEVIAFRQSLDIAPGAPPGAYTLDVGAFSPSLDARLPVLNEGSNGAWQMAGTALSVGPIQVERAAAPLTEPPPIQQPVQAAFGRDAVTFLGSDRDRSDLRPGETLALTLYWQAGQAVEGAHTVVVWLSGEGGDVPLWHGHPVHGLYPFARWRPGEFVRDRYALRLPRDALAGDYDLHLALLDARGERIAARTTQVAPANGAGSDVLSLGTIHVRGSDRRWEPPEFEHPIGARLGGKVELLGYDLDGDLVAPGGTLQLTLVWRCREAMDVAYTVFTHLLDAGEQVRGQRDNPPVRGTYPTTLWVPGEIVVDEYEIPVATDAVPGRYVVEVGMYDPATMQRLPVLDPTAALGDRVLLADVQVVNRE